MKNKFLKISMFVSSFIPLYFLIIVKELTEIINGNLTFNVTNSIMLSLNFIFIVIGILGVILNFKAKKVKKIEVFYVKNATCQYFLPYFPIFVLFALAFELEFISMALVYLFILIMLGIVYVKNNLFYINPFFNIIGFSSYEITYKLDDNTSAKMLVFSFNKVEKGIITINEYFVK